MAERSSQALSQPPRDHVVATAWRERDDDAHRLAGPGILGRGAGCGAEQGQAERCQRRKQVWFASLHICILRRARRQLLQWKKRVEANAHEVDVT